MGIHLDVDLNHIFTADKEFMDKLAKKVLVEANKAIDDLVITEKDMNGLKGEFLDAMSDKMCKPEKYMNNFWPSIVKKWHTKCKKMIDNIVILKK